MSNPLGYAQPPYLGAFKTLTGALRFSTAGKSSLIRVRVLYCIILKMALNIKDLYGNSVID